MVVIDQVGAHGEGVFGQARLKGGVTVEPTLRIHQEVRGTAQQESESFRGPLEHVVDNAKELFVVRSACLRRFG